MVTWHNRNLWNTIIPQIYPFETVAIDQSFTDVGFCEVLVELAVVIGFIARIDKEIAVDNDDRTLHLADLYSRDDMYTVIIAVNEICKYEYFLAIIGSLYKPSLLKVPYVCWNSFLRLFSKNISWESLWILTCVVNF